MPFEQREDCCNQHLRNNRKVGRNQEHGKHAEDADSTVPAVEGSTNLLRASICMMVPATAMPAPASMSAIVRGRRLAAGS